jgi:hypothetical protein
MSYEDEENIRLGELVGQVHREVTGEALQFMEMPCLEAIEAGMNALRESERLVTDLLNDTTHP